MKILLVLIAIIAVIIVAVVAIGYALPEQHIVSRSASFHATPQQIYTLIQGSQSWRPDVARSEPVTAPDGRSYVRETDRHGETITYEILAQQPPYALDRRIATETLPYAGTWHYSILPNGNSTNVTITENGQVFNPIFRFVSRFIIGHTSTIDSYLRALGKATGSAPVQISN